MVEEVKPLVPPEGEKGLTWSRQEDRTVWFVEAAGVGKTSAWQHGRKVVQVWSCGYVNSGTQVIQGPRNFSVFTSLGSFEMDDSSQR